ncbi:hypothetical protein CHU98_g8908 [Xylaria longipes]|nr:hypothetical protein CHU98_g8908 [Xylaria longipes]
MGRRGFDSLVQACSGINVAEAVAYGGGDVSRALPCQALDHGAGYLLAAGVCAAVYHRERDREAGRSVGAYVVDVSLAGVGKYLRSLGQFEGRSGFEGDDVTVLGVDGDRTEDEKALFETRDTSFGEMTFLRHSASVEGLEPGWERMPSPLGSDEAVWDGISIRLIYKTEALGWMDGWRIRRLNKNAREARGKSIENTTINILHSQRRQFHRNEIKTDVENTITDDVAVETSRTTELASSGPGKPHINAYILAAFLRDTFLIRTN